MREIETPEKAQRKRGLFNKFLDVIERLGNKLPDPTVLFLWLCAIVLALSWIGAKLGWSVVHPATGAEVTVFNLLSAEGIQYMFSTVVTNVTSFGPFGIAMIIMLAVGILESSGLMRNLFLSMGLRVGGRWLTVVIILLGINANMASDIGLIILPPLAAMLFVEAGRHPLLGMCCAYAACCCGLAANFLVSVGDVTITGISISAAQVIDPNFTMNPACNWYFFAVAVLVLLPVAAFVTDKILEPRLGKWHGEGAVDCDSMESFQMSDLEKKALKKTGYFTLVVIAIFVLAVSPLWGILRDPDGVPIYLVRGKQLPAIVMTITLVMGLPGLFYGRLVGTIKNGKDFGQACKKALST